MAKVLIIDDDRTTCTMLSNLVNQMGHEAVCEYTLHAGLNEARAHLYNIVFLDVQMPDGSGLDILPKIRDTPSSPEVIIMTGFGSVDGAEIAIKNGAWDYIQKTDSPRKIILSLQRVIQYRQEMQKAKKSAVALKLDGVIGNSDPMQACFDLLAQVAFSNINVLLMGETGTGKELFARAIHENSERSRNNFVVIDCAALPETLVESLLFGHTKGAFTGADKTQTGLVAQADGGTLFLDEVGELSLSIQKVFLRVLQERSFRPVGSKQEIRSDFRLLAATNQNLDYMVQSGRFRADLLYRLKTFTITLPPLRKRLEDIKPLVLYHVARLCERGGIGTKGFSPDFFDVLADYSWPGNIREIVNVLEMTLSAAGLEQTLFPRHLPESLRIHAAQTALSDTDHYQSNSEPIAKSSPILPSFRVFRKTAVENAEKEYLQRLLMLSKGSAQKACRISELSRSRFYQLLKQHKLSMHG